MNNNNDKYANVKPDVILNTAGDLYNAEYCICETQIDKDNFKRYTNEYFERHIFVKSIQGQAVVITPIEIIELDEDENKNELKTVNTIYEFSKLSNFRESKSEDNYNTKSVNKNTQKQEFKIKNFADYWISNASPAKRTYEGITFDANPNFNNPSLFNMWNGFVEPKKGDVKPFINHLNRLLGSKEYVDHVVKTLAWVVRFPHKNPGVTIVLIGEQGCGKSTVSHSLRAICPDHSRGVRNLANDLFGFNGGYLHTKFFLHEESSWAGDKKTASQLKDIITGEQRRVEIKNINAFEIKNIGFHIFTSNSDNPINVENSDRRHNIFKCSSELIGNRKYWKEYYSWINGEGKHFLLNYLQNEVDLTGFDVKDIIDTDAKIGVKTNNFEGMDRFLYNYLMGECEFYDVEEDEELSSQKWIHSDIEVSRKDLYNKYVEYCNTHNKNWLRDMGQCKFTADLAKIFSFPPKFNDNWKRKNKPPFFRIPVRYIARQYFASHVKTPHLFGMTPEDELKKEAEERKKEYEANLKAGMFNSPKKEFPAEVKIEVPKYMPKFGKQEEYYGEQK